MAQDNSRLREVRESEGLTIAKLSRLADLNEKTIRERETGKRTCTQVTRQKIIKGLNKNPVKSQEWKYEDIF